MDNNYTLQTVERALSFLEYVATAPVPPNVRDVAKALDLNITTSYHLLRTLVARMQVSPREPYRQYQERLRAYNCELAAQLHNATTREQRVKAADRLKGWAEDFRVLSAGR